MASVPTAIIFSLHLCVGASIYPFQDASLPVPERVTDLLGRMSRDELIGQTWHPESQPAALLTSFCKNGVGGTAIPSDSFDPLTNLRARNALQAACMNAQPHGIPLSFHQEGLHSGALGGTVFPEPLLTACAWNASLATAIGAALAFEARGAGVDNVWSPVVNMWTDDRFGRYQEGFSPDPMITSTLARALVLGLQGGPSTADDYLPGGPNASAWATAKHFAGYGSAAGGLNGGPFILSNRTLFEWYLRPWRAMAAVGLRGAMPSHNSVLDVPMHGNRWLTRNVLRLEFGAGNISLVSDCNDIGAMQFFRVAGNLSRNTGLAMRAGLDGDLQCGRLGSGGLEDQAYYSNIPAALADGFATEADLRELAQHVLTQKFAAGLFEQPMAPEAWVSRLNAPEHRRLAYEAAAQGVVLLQNNGLLPIDFSRKPRVALIGPQVACFGGGEVATASCDARINWLGSYILWAPGVPVPLLPEALNTTFPGVPFTTAQGCSIDGDPRLDLIPAAVAAAAAADVAIVAVGDSMASCGEWADRDSLDLPGGQLALLEALANTSTPLVVVLVNGRAASFGPANALLTKFAAVVEAWRPGEEGAQAVLDVISGAVVPSGKLASQWAQNVGQMNGGAQPWLARRRAKWISNARSPPDPTDGRVYDNYVATAYSSFPLFRFGHGLSYTAFQYKTLSMSPPVPIASLPGGGTFSGRGRQGYVDAINTAVTTASVTVCNTGGRDATEVVQVYSQDPVGDWGSDTLVVPYWKRLVGFARVRIAAGGCETAAIPLLADDIALYDDSMTLRIQPGAYNITAGGRSDTDFLNAMLVMA